MTHFLDVREVTCPQHLKSLITKIRQMDPGETVELFTLDPDVETDVRTWLKRTGHSFMGSVHGEDGIRIFVEKKPASQA
jgi:TusA-related sulfurtransferase